MENWDSTGGVTSPKPPLWIRGPRRRFPTMLAAILAAAAAVAAALTVNPSPAGVGRPGEYRHARIHFGGAPKRTTAALSVLRAPAALRRRLKAAHRRAQWEQEAEMLNLQERLADRLCRHLLAMPLSDAFNPPPGDFSHNRIHNSDKVSLPPSFLAQLQAHGIEPPWQFSIEPDLTASPSSAPRPAIVQISTTTSTSATSALPAAANDAFAGPTMSTAAAGAAKQIPACSSSSSRSRRRRSVGAPAGVIAGTPIGDDAVVVDSPIAPEGAPAAPRRRLFASPLDFRSSPNYVFLPKWMLRALHISPFSRVLVCRSAALPKASLVSLRPADADFLAATDQRRILEGELRHYSTLGRGTRVALCFRHKTFEFLVEALRDAEGRSVNAVSIQDADVSTDILPPLQPPTDAAGGDTPPL
eukprot:GHVU01049089.1.p1 GENE.GHVU01049089.1~~GHVU01049089.1.p1  ORF type:complete len:431 (+),score=66.64 GHVU01049089.1:49-1293(+)